MCRKELVADSTTADNESVVGDECHIISGQVNGPRHDIEFPINQIDTIDNLILLCKVHHKVIDDQCETYTVGLLHTLKSNHEEWVKTALDQSTPKGIKIRQIKENIPNHLVRLVTGRDLLTMLSDAHGYQFEHDEPKSEAEANLLASFLQHAQDYGELSTDLDVGDRVQTAYRLSFLLNELEEGGFWAFGSREARKLEGGVGAPSDFRISILHIVRSTNSNIVKVDLELSSEDI
jgi:hypothetical protein